LVSHGRIAALLTHADPQLSGIPRNKYEVHGTITGPEGAKAEIVSVWMVRYGEDYPRFITAYPRN